MQRSELLIHVQTVNYWQLICWQDSFLFRYADDSFTSAFVSTVGIRLQRHRRPGALPPITTAYYRGAMGFILNVR
uniref:Uncharacterized protein n=1 Tax=Macrostomum lignano TaxID=282301 RepID=A0A1I8F1D4_9PLAT